MRSAVGVEIPIAIAIGRSAALLGRGIAFPAGSPAVRASLAVAIAVGFWEIIL